MKFRSLVVFFLLFSLNSFGDGNPNEVKFFNGARLVVNFIRGFPREILYYGPGSAAPRKINFGDKALVKILSNKNIGLSPEEIVNKEFEGLTPRFWPVVVTYDPQNAYTSARLFISENGEVLTVSRQGKGGGFNVESFEFPDKWGIYRMTFDEIDYLVLVEERVNQRTLVHYLRLSDGKMATKKDWTPFGEHGNFDSNTGLFREHTAAGEWVTYAPNEFRFNAIDQVSATDNAWFPDFKQSQIQKWDLLEDTLNLKLDSIGPFFTEVKAPPPEKKEEAKKEAEKKEVSIAKRGEEDIAAMKAERDNFKKAAAEFAEFMKTRPRKDNEVEVNRIGEKTDYKPLVAFHGNRFVLVATQALVLNVVDSWTDEILQEIQLEDDSYTILNTPNGSTTTIAYPRLHVEALYNQPTMANPKLEFVYRHEESIPKFCADVVLRESFFNGVSK